MNHFLRQPEQYVRNINVIDGYCKQNALYLQRMTGQDYDKCLEFVRKKITADESAQKMKDPETRFLVKKSEGNREPAVTTFQNYLRVIEERGLIVAPTLTTYLPAHMKKSIIAEYIGGNLEKRKATKKLMFRDKMAGDEKGEAFHNLLQATFKIKNNSISGAHASPYQILYNKSSHSTLTSTCRTATSYANANNEKFLTGNRHYWSPEITRSNILSICSITHEDEFQFVMDTFDLHYPTTDEVMECIEYSTQHYWRSDEEMCSLRELVDALQPVERAMFMYIGDMYHLAKHNDKLVRELLFDFSRYGTDLMKNGPDPIKDLEEADQYLDELNEDGAALANLLTSDLLAGIQLRKAREDKPEAYLAAAHAARNITASLEKWKVLIKGLWSTDNLPASIYRVPSLYRRCAIVSDTDSTIFTNQSWVDWYCGDVNFSKEAYGIGYVTTYLASQMVKHLLACMSANMGVAKEQIHQLTMKSEFYFPTLSLTTMAKNYFSYISAQEGNVFDELDMEIKGVSLKSSNWPAAVAKRLKGYMGELMSKVMEKGPMSKDEILQPVYEMEREILDDIDSGGYRFLTTSQIKDTSSYANPATSPYVHHTLWEEVFAPKYGHVGDPPYQSIKVSVTIGKPGAFKEWLAGLEDRELAARMEQWMKRNNKTDIAMFRLPEPVLQVSGIPKEIIKVVDRRKLLFNTVSGFYLVLEAMGLFMMDKTRSRFVSDFYTPPENPKVVPL